MVSSIRPVYATTVDLGPLVAQGSFSPLLLVRQAWNDWVSQKLARRVTFLGKAAKAPPTCVFDPNTTGQQDPLDGISVLQDWWTSSLNDKQLSSAQLELRESQENGWIWVTTATMASDGKRATLTLQMGIASTEFRVQPLGWLVRAPGFWKTLTSRVAVFTNGKQLEYGAFTSHSRGEIRTIVSSLYDPERTLPTVVLSVKNSTSTLPLDPNLARLVSQELFALAHVHLLSDSGAAWELSDEIGSEHACYNGAIRIYWPAFSSEQLPDYRTLLNLDRLAIEDTKHIGTKVAASVLRKIAPVSALRFLPPPLFADVALSRREEQRTRDLEKIKSEISDKTLQDFIELELKAIEDRHANEIEAIHAQYRQRYSLADQDPSPGDGGDEGVFIEYFRSEGGRRPVLDFADDEFGKNQSTRDKYLESLTMLGSRFTQQGSLYFTRLAQARVVTRTGRTAHLWEYRSLNLQGQWVRVLFSLLERRAVLLHAVSKRQNRLDPDDVETARKRLELFLAK